MKWQKEKEKQAQAFDSAPVTTQPAPSQEINTAGSAVMGSTTYASMSETQAQPVQRPQENMFTPISRFDSSGMSSGSGGGLGLPHQQEVEIRIIS